MKGSPEVRLTHMKPTQQIYWLHVSCSQLQLSVPTAANTTWFLGITPTAVLFFCIWRCRIVDSPDASLLHQRPNSSSGCLHDHSPAEAQVWRWRTVHFSGATDQQQTSSYRRTLDSSKTVCHGHLRQQHWPLAMAVAHGVCQLCGTPRAACSTRHRWQRVVWDGWGVVMKCCTSVAPYCVDTSWMCLWLRPGPTVVLCETCTQSQACSGCGVILWETWLTAAQGGCSSVGQGHV